VHQCAAAIGVNFEEKIMIEDYKLPVENRAGMLMAQRSEDFTVEENIDRKIKYHQAEIERLENSKVELAPLLKMRISDIRQAMNY
jgi:hypothetical protein